MIYVAAEALGCSHNTIIARLAKSEKLRAIQVAARQAEGFIPRLGRRTRTERGYVYLLREDVRGLVKIGRAVNPRNRVQKIAAILPSTCRVVGLIEAANMEELEKELHRRFADRRVKGEWFKLDAGHLEEVQVDYASAWATDVLATLGVL